MARRKPPESIVEQHSAYVEWSSRRDELLDQQATVRAQAVQLRELVDRQHADHQEAVRQAIASKSVVPRQPEVASFTHLADAENLVRMALEQHRQLEPGVLAEVADGGGLEAARDRLRVTTTNISEPVKLVEDAVNDLRMTLGVLARLVRAQDAAQGVTPSRAAAAIDQRAATLTLDDLAVAVRHDLPIEQAAVRVEDVVREVTRVSPEDEEQARLTKERVAQELRRRDNAAWSNRRGLVVQLDEHGAFATGSPHQAGRTPLGHLG